MRHTASAVPEKRDIKAYAECAKIVHTSKNRTGSALLFNPNMNYIHIQYIGLKLGYMAPTNGSHS